MNGLLKISKLNKYEVLNLIVNQPDKLNNYIFSLNIWGLVKNEIEINDVLYILNKGKISEINMEFVNTDNAMSIIEDWKNKYYRNNDNKYCKFDTNMASVTIINMQVTSISYRVR